jgi:citrate synthase
MTTWIDRDAAQARLGVKAQTLYAYASRGRIRMQPDPADSRRSLYSAEDIAEISVRKARGRKPSSIAASSMEWGEPAIPTSLSTAHRGKLYYCGRDATELAQHATLEQVAALLWDVKGQPSFADVAGTAEPDIFAMLARMAKAGQPIIGRSNEYLAIDAASIIGQLATVSGAAVGSSPVHQRLAQAWNCEAQGAETIRQALVAMADHDLNASTFAARVAASTGASLPACLLAGLATLSGPRHGGAGKALLALLADARRQNAGDAVAQWLARDHMLPGFGHNLYPNGDPRAALMLSNMEPFDDLEALARTVFDLSGLLPNCDFALAAMTKALNLPEDAPLTIFLIGRSVGWCAHVIEQNQVGSLIRPRGRYQGHLPI